MLIKATSTHWNSDVPFISAGRGRRPDGRVPPELREHSGSSSRGVLVRMMPCSPEPRGKAAVSLFKPEKRAERLQPGRTGGS